jgi:gliding motility-associated-like protein
LYIFGGIAPVQAQFVYQESCMNGTGIFAPNGHAYYTAARGIDAPGSGWLRLTDDTGDQLGYVLAEGNYSSRLGLTIEFDFVVWTSSSPTPADGFSVFLFDGSVTDNAFVPGAKGGALGYLPRNSESGQSSGYLGIGIDEFGNYTNYVNNGFHPHAITICGPSSENYSFLASTFSDFAEAKDPALINTSISYPGFSSSRPSESQYFRRVKVELTPNGSGGMTVNVYLKIDVAGAFLHVLGPVNVVSIAPEYLRVGFAGVTGGSTAVHEVRNVVIRTSGDLLAFKSFGGCIKSVDTPVNIFSNIYNGSNKTIGNIEILDTLPADFVATNVNITGGSWTYSPPPLTGTLLPDERTVYTYFIDIVSNTNARITWTGYFSSLAKNQPIVSSVYAVPVAEDFLTDDNYASETTYFTPLPSIQDIEVCRLEPLNIPEIEPVTGHTVKWFDSNMAELPDMSPPGSTVAGNHAYYIKYSNNTVKCEGDSTKLEINVHPLPEADFETVKSGICYDNIPTVTLKNLTDTNIYHIFRDSLMNEKIVSVTGVTEYSQQMQRLQNTQNYYIQVVNSYSCVRKDVTKITFEPVTVSILTDKLPVFREKSEYDYQLETDAESPYFSIVEGNLPAGIVMDNLGAITGKPQTGEYGSWDFTVRVTDINGCTTSRTYPYDVDIFIPKIFTPNGDGINDFFLKGFKIIVSDRLGITIFEGDDGWDGTYNGKPAPENIYYYKALLPNDKITTGYIGLIGRE